MKLIIAVVQDEDSSRLLSELKKTFPDATERILHALRNEPYDLWQKDASMGTDSPEENS